MLIKLSKNNPHFNVIYFIKHSVSKKTNQRITNQGLIQDFPEGDANPKGGAPTNYSARFSWKLHKNQENWTEGVSKISLCISATANEFLWWTINTLNLAMHRNLCKESSRPCRINYINEQNPADLTTLSFQTTISSCCARFFSWKLYFLLLPSVGQKSLLVVRSSLKEAPQTVFLSLRFSAWTLKTPPFKICLP